MKTSNMKKIWFAIGLCLVLAGILVFSLLAAPYKYLGLVFIIGAAIYLAIIFVSKKTDKKPERKFRSKTREEIARHQRNR